MKLLSTRRPRPARRRWDARARSKLDFKTILIACFGKALFWVLTWQELLKTSRATHSISADLMMIFGLFLLQGSRLITMFTFRMRIGSSSGVFFNARLDGLNNARFWLNPVDHEIIYKSEKSHIPTHRARRLRVTGNKRSGAFIYL